MTLNGDILRFLVIILLSQVKLSDGTLYACNASATCGCSMNSAAVSRIVGGENASIGTWTWAVSISLYDEFVCGGSILSDSWIITAAHCVSEYRASYTTIHAGSTVVSSGTQNRTVSKVFIHASYDPLTYENDIALLKLATPLSMSDPYVSQICIPSVSSSVLSAGEWPPAGISVVAVGWGRLSEGGSLPSNLQQVTLQTIDYRDSTCNSSIANEQIQFCAGVPGGEKDSCQGDSGGPLMMFTASNQWVLVGVVSSGDGCARAEFSGIYTRVAAFTSWILSFTNTSVSTITPSIPITTTSSVETTTISTTTYTMIDSLGNTFTTSIFNVFSLVLYSFFAKSFR